MWYTINFFILALQVLPPVLRKQNISAFTQALVKPVDTLYYTWSQMRERNVYKMRHTGQICYLRKALNDAFDPSERRIYIGEGNIYDTTYIYTEGEAQEVYTGTESEATTLWLRTEGETADKGLTL